MLSRLPSTCNRLQRSSLASVNAIRLCSTNRFSHYHSVDADDIAALKTMVGSVLTDSEDIGPYNTDWMNKYRGGGKVVLRPKTTEEVSSALRYCNEKNIAVVPQGGNTGLGMHGYYYTTTTTRSLYIYYKQLLLNLLTPLWPS